jgi:hypothetical protein
LFAKRHLQLITHEGDLTDELNIIRRGAVQQHTITPKNAFEARLQKCGSAITTGNSCEFPGAIETLGYQSLIKSFTKFW